MIIQMTQTIQTHGKYFLANHQYEASGTIFSAIDISLPRLKNNGQVAEQYVVTIDGITYHIPWSTCAEVTKAIPLEMQNHEKAYVKEIMDDRKDWEADWKKATGIKVNNNAGADIDLREYEKIKSLIKTGPREIV